MSARNPVLIWNESGEDGFELRDLFAAFALAGLIAQYGNQGSGAGKYCYELADAMLAERGRER